MQIRVSMFFGFFGFVMTLNLVPGISSCNGDDYKLAIDMKASEKKIVSRQIVQLRAPASTSVGAIYSVGFHADRQIFPKDFPHETNRTYRASHPVGFQNSLAGTNLMFSLYLMPFARRSTTPFGDSTSQVTERSLHTAGLALAYLF